MSYNESDEHSWNIFRQSLEPFDIPYSINSSLEWSAMCIYRTSNRRAGCRNRTPLACKSTDVMIMTWIVAASDTTDKLPIRYTNRSNQVQA